MHKVSRSLLLAGVMAFGTLTAACGDKVNIVQPTSTAPTGITAITVTPSSATIGIGATNAISLAVAVVADAATPKTVTWTTSSAAVATVDATGKVTGVANGTVTITATATADPTKAAAAVITVAGGIQNTVNTVAISAVTQGGLPVQLNNVFGQVDVTLFISGPGGTLNLIQNCTATGATSTTGDVIVAQQQVAGSQNQSPVTLSYNTAATGAVTSGVAVPNASSATPIFLNGNCVLKASLGTAIATNVTPITLNNASTYRYALTTTGASAISGLNSLLYNSGDLTAVIQPVNYAGGSIAFISGTFGAGFTFTNVAPAAGTQTFTVTFPGSIVTGALPVAPATSSISNYTSPAAGDVVAVTSNITTTGTNGFVSGTTSQIIRIDNGAPVAIVGTVANPSGAQITNVNGWLNGSSAFAAGVIAPVDQGALAPTPTGTNSITTVVGYTTGAAFTALTGSGTYGLPIGSGIGPTQCSQTGYSIATSPSVPAVIPNSAAGVNTQYRARAFFTDKVGNVRCQDLVSTGGALSAVSGAFGVDAQAPQLAFQSGSNGVAGSGNKVITAGATITYAYGDSISGQTAGSEVAVSDFRNFSTANCVVGATVNGCTATGSGIGFVIDQGGPAQAYYTVSAQSIDQAGNKSTPVTLTFLLDGTAPVVQGISIPQNLVGGTAATFTSTATDNVDLASTNFNIQYSAATGVNLYYAGNTYGTKYTQANVVTTASVTATVPNFVQQLQAVDGANAPVALTAADSGEAASVAVRAVDAAGNVSAASVAAIPGINISSKAGFSAADFTSWADTNQATTVSNGAGVLARSTTLIARALLTTGTSQTAPVPFTQVCFFYLANAGDPAIPAGTYAPAVGSSGSNCVNAPNIVDLPGISRTWVYSLVGFDPPTPLGTVGTLNIIAVGIKGAGVGIVSAPNAQITVAP